jgi:hypothetical protein
MATASEALNELGITEWVMRGEPTKVEEFNAMFRKVTGSKSDGTAVETADTSKWGVTWQQVSEKMTAMDAAAPMKELRILRDAKLAETDWTANSDVTMSADMKTYRQELRDLPAHNNGKNAALEEDGRTLKNVTWPKKPA